MFFDALYMHVLHIGITCNLLTYIYIYMYDLDFLDLGILTWKSNLQNPRFKGQLGVPLTVYPWYLSYSLGILGDYTHKYPRVIGLIFRDFP